MDIYTPESERSELRSLFAPIEESARMRLRQQYGDALSRLASSQAARGILRSGISEYPRTRLAQGLLQGEADIQSRLADLFGRTEAQRSLARTQAGLTDWLRSREFERQKILADLLDEGSLLRDIFSGFGAAGTAAGGIGMLLAGL